jgi:hypothetical protein
MWNSITFSLKKVEQFHFFWNCSTKSGTVPLCVGLFGYCSNYICGEFIMQQLFSLLSLLPQARRAFMHHIMCI